jgi:hypothetical protein
MKKGSSPLKSPSKRPRKADAENCSPEKMSESYNSPSKKMSSPSKGSQQRKSQRRRISVNTEKVDSPVKQIESTQNLQVPNTQEGEANTSPLKSCPKSPLKRMKNLEDKDNVENQENIEQTYINSTDVKEDSDEEESESQLSAKFVDETPKSILG